MTVRRQTTEQPPSSSKSVEIIESAKQNPRRDDSQRDHGTGLITPIFGPRVIHAFEPNLSLEDRIRPFLSPHIDEPLAGLDAHLTREKAERNRK